MGLARVIEISDGVMALNQRAMWTWREEKMYTLRFVPLEECDDCAVCLWNKEAQMTLQKETQGLEFLSTSLSIFTHLWREAKLSIHSTLSLWEITIYIPCIPITSCLDISVIKSYVVFTPSFFFASWDRGYWWDAWSGAARLSAPLRSHCLQLLSVYLSRRK